MALYLKEGDTAPKFRGQLLDGTTPINLTLVALAKLKIQAPDGTLVVDGNLTVEDQNTATGWVNRAWQAGETAIPDNYRCEVEVTWTDGTKQTFPPDEYGLVIITPDL